MECFLTKKNLRFNTDQPPPPVKMYVEYVCHRCNKIFRHAELLLIHLGTECHIVKSRSYIKSRIEAGDMEYLCKYLDDMIASLQATIETNLQNPTIDKKGLIALGNQIRKVTTKFNVLCGFISVDLEDDKDKDMFKNLRHKEKFLDLIRKYREELKALKDKYALILLL